MNTEKSIAWLKTMIDGVDLRGCAVLTNVECFIGCNVFIYSRDDDYSYLFPTPSFAVMSVSRIIPLYFPEDDETNENDFYKWVYEWCEKFHMVKQLVSTNVIDSNFWASNIAENMYKLLPCNDIYSVKGAYNGFDSIVVASGPSVDSSIEKIKEMQEAGGIVIACNSSMRILVKNGIIPTYVISADPRDTTYSGIEGCDTEGITLVCPYYCNSKVVNSFSKIMTWSGKNELLKYIYKSLNRPSSDICEIGTVSVSMIDFAKHIGCSRVYLFGQDLCFKKDGQYGNSMAHAEGRFRNTENSIFVESNSGEMMPTDDILLNYKYIIESYIANNSSGIEFFNMSKNGAKINGAKYVG